MNKERVIEILNDLRSYEYAVKNTVGQNSGPLIPVSLNSNRLVRADKWDHRRYSHIVSMTRGAIEDILSDNQRDVINWKYLERNKMSLNDIAKKLNRDRGTISNWHTEALKQLSKALGPLDEHYLDINNIEHMFDLNWKYQEPA